MRVYYNDIVKYVPEFPNNLDYIDPEAPDDVKDFVDVLKSSEYAEILRGHGHIDVVVDFVKALMNGEPIQPHQVHVMQYIPLKIGEYLVYKPSEGELTDEEVIDYRALPEIIPLEIDVERGVVRVVNKEIEAKPAQMLRLAQLVGDYTALMEAGLKHLQGLLNVLEMSLSKIGFTDPVVKQIDYHLVEMSMVSKEQPATSVDVELDATEAGGIVSYRLTISDDKAGFRFVAVSPARHISYDASISDIVNLANKLADDVAATWFIGTGFYNEHKKRGLGYTVRYWYTGDEVVVMTDEKFDVKHVKLPRVPGFEAVADEIVERALNRAAAKAQMRLSGKPIYRYDNGIVYILPPIEVTGRDAGEVIDKAAAMIEKFRKLFPREFEAEVERFAAAAAYIASLYGKGRAPGRVKVSGALPLP